MSPDTAPVKSLLRIEWLLITCLLLSIGLLIGGPSLLRTRIVLLPESGLETAVRTDEAAGGNSMGELDAQTPFAWRCELRDASPYPFCGVEILLDGERQAGLDLTRVERVRLHLDYEGPARSLRLFLRNFDARYSRVEDPLSTKFNQIEFSPSSLVDGLEVSLRDFYVANWWMSAYDIAPQLGHPQFDNVVSIELQTGTVPALGEHRFRLRSIELEGQRISSEQLYLGLVLAWLALIMGWVLHRLLELKRELSQRRQREAELLQVNAVLDARSRKLETRAQTDPLTGALNRRGLEQGIREALSESRSSEASLSLVLLDLDHFKRINDGHGHAMGDRVLSELSELVQRHIRDSDRLARWGGEEFVLLCRNCDARQALGLAEKLRELIEGHDFGAELKVTASFGVATLHPGQTLEQLFAAADAALYRAKHAGRNRVLAESL